jgi:cysteinyl-tRNA synthetase
MSLKFYNTLKREVEEFKPENEIVTMYTCGPTVYNYAHIGNFRAMISYDLTKRYLKYRGYKVKHVMNITDIDDKIIRDSKKSGKNLKDFTEYWANLFFNDLELLKIDKAEIIPWATREIGPMVEIVKILLNKGHAYKTKSGDIYFRITSFENYGKLANLNPEFLKKNADGRLNDADEYQKDDAKDFALWKAYDPDDGDVFWETEIGKGRPGWHLECSAMSHKYLGLPIDIHMGGVDLIFPHHTNEIAQTEAAYGKKFANYWLHNEHLVVNGQKMSKSLGNFYTLNDLLNKGYDPMAIRLELISTNYRQKLDFKEDNLKKNVETIKKFHEFIDKLDHIKSDKDNPNIDSIIKQAKNDFIYEMDNDLNISGGLATIFVFMGEINKLMDSISINDAEKIKETIKGFDSIIGVMLKEKEVIPKEIFDIAEKRLLARKAKDWAMSDQLREEISSKGYNISDEKEGYRIKKK